VILGESTVIVITPCRNLTHSKVLCGTIEPSWGEISMKFL
jgi:hypothetical protein